MQAATKRSKAVNNNSQYNPYASRKSNGDGIDDLANEVLEDTPPQKQAQTLDERLDSGPKADSSASPSEKSINPEALTYTLPTASTQERIDSKKTRLPTLPPPCAMSGRQHGKTSKKNRQRGHSHEPLLAVANTASESLKNLPVSPPDDLEVGQSSNVTSSNWPSSPDVAELSRKLTLLMPKDAEDVESPRASFAASGSPSKVISQKFTTLQRGKGALKKVKRALSSCKGSSDETGISWRDRFQSSSSRSILSELTGLGREKKGFEVEGSANVSSRRQGEGDNLIKGETKASTSGSARIPLPIYESMKTKRLSSISTEGLVSPSKATDDSPRGHRHTKSADFGALLKSDMNPDKMKISELINKAKKSRRARDDLSPLTEDNPISAEPGPTPHDSTNTSNPQKSASQVNTPPSSCSQTGNTQASSIENNLADLGLINRSQTSLGQSTRSQADHGRSSRSQSGFGLFHRFGRANRAQTNLGQANLAQVNQSDRPDENQVYTMNNPHPLRMHTKPMEFASKQIYRTAQATDTNGAQSNKNLRNAKIVTTGRHLSTVPDADENLADPDAITPAPDTRVRENSEHNVMASDPSSDDGAAEDSADELGLDSVEHSERILKLKRKSGSADLRSISSKKFRKLGLGTEATSQGTLISDTSRSTTSNSKRVLETSDGKKPLKRSTLSTSTRRYGMHIFDVPKGKEKEVTEEGAEGEGEQAMHGGSSAAGYKAHCDRLEAMYGQRNSRAAGALEEEKDSMSFDELQVSQFRV